MTAWLEFTAVTVYIVILGWLFWNDLGTWFTHHGDVCTGCMRHWVVPGCPVHDPRARTAAK